MDGGTIVRFGNCWMTRSEEPTTWRMAPRHRCGIELGLLGHSSALKLAAAPLIPAADRSVTLCGDAGASPGPVGPTTVSSKGPG